MGICTVPYCIGAFLYEPFSALGKHKSASHELEQWGQWLVVLGTVHLRAEDH